MNEQELTKHEVLAQAANPRPWKWEGWETETFATMHIRTTPKMRFVADALLGLSVDLPAEYVNVLHIDRDNDFLEGEERNYAYVLDACNSFPDALAEIRRLRAGIAGLRQEHGYHTIQVDDGDGYTDEMEEPCPATDPFQRGPCTCGADAHNARIDALLQGEERA